MVKAKASLLYLRRVLIQSRNKKSTLFLLQEIRAPGAFTGTISGLVRGSAFCKELTSHWGQAHTALDGRRTQRGKETC